MIRLSVPPCEIAQVFDVSRLSRRCRHRYIQGTCDMPLCPEIVSGADSGGRQAEHDLDLRVI